MHAFLMHMDIDLLPVSVAFDFRQKAKCDNSCTWLIKVRDRKWVNPVLLRLAGTGLRPTIRLRAAKTKVQLEIGAVRMN